MTIILPATGELPTSLEDLDDFPVFDLPPYPKIKSMDMSAAVCPQTDADAFHPTYNISREQFISILRACSVCDIAVQCLDAALEYPEKEDWGIWGGTTRDERLAIRNDPTLRAEYLARLTDIRRNRVPRNPIRAAQLADAS